MMTAAVLSSAWRGPHLCASPSKNDALFLQEVVGCLLVDSKDVPPENPPTPSTVCSRDDHGESIHDDYDYYDREESLVRDGPTGGIVRSSATITTTDAATRVQAQTRRYLQQRRYQIHQLQARLQQIALEKQEQLAAIERRKDRKLRRIQRKRDRADERMEQEYQKVTGIVHYLKGNESLCRKELVNHRVVCRDLKTDNHRLLVARERTLHSVQHKQRQVQELEALNHQLQATLLVQKEAIGRLEACLLPQPSTFMSAVKQRPHNTNQSAKSYESSIKVNCVNEAEENCFHYRLVQDVYTLRT